MKLDFEHFILQVSRIRGLSIGDVIFRPNAQSSYRWLPVIIQIILLF